MTSKQKARKRRGPTPERLKIKVDWQTAVGKALKKQRPKEGWPVAESEKKQSPTG
jgi:hypothetical protein